jgi:hypothetical protein
MSKGEVDPVIETLEVTALIKRPKHGSHRLVDGGNHSHGARRFRDV